MKKLLASLFVICLTTTTVFAAEQAKKVLPADAQKIEQIRMHREAVFERRLELTEVQKLKAREIRKSSFEKLKPVMEEIKSKKQEAEMVRRSRMAVQMQEEKLAVIDGELKILEKKANDIRRANMKEFESILTRQQKKTLKQMKKEGRKRYHSAHPVRPHMPAQPFLKQPVHK